MSLHSLTPTSKCLNCLRTVLQVAHLHHSARVHSAHHRDLAAFEPHAAAAWKVMLPAVEGEQTGAAVLGVQRHVPLSPGHSEFSCDVRDAHPDTAEQPAEHLMTTSAGCQEETLVMIHTIFLHQERQSTMTLYLSQPNSLKFNSITHQFNGHFTCKHGLSNNTSVTALMPLSHKWRIS